MLYNALKKIIESSGLTKQLMRKVDVLYLAGKITEEQYLDICNMKNDEVNDNDTQS